ncbi:MAG: 2-dehydropantoate 2-reductase [Rhodospirillaceae bacterium]|nr:2-dehydropantoate 2-reductase [Rhodospirillaceae bacterium]
MKFAILGAGALGSILGGHLIRAGNDVAMLARGRRAADLRDNGIRVQGLSDLTVPCQVVTDPAALQEADVLIVTVKTYQTEDAIQPLKHLRVGSVFSVANGVLKNRQLGAVFGDDKVLGSIAMVSGELLGDGAVNFTVNQLLEIGALPSGPSAVGSTIAEHLNDAVINTAVSETIQTDEWSKYVNWSGMMALSVLTRLATYKFLADPKAARVAAKVMRETAALAAALEIPLSDRPPVACDAIVGGSEDDAVAFLQKLGRSFEKNAPQHRVSALQDVERGQHLEIHETLGHTIAEAGRLGVPVPTIETCYGLIGAVDRWIDN